MPSTAAGEEEKPEFVGTVSGSGRQLPWPQGERIGVEDQSGEQVGWPQPVPLKAYSKPALEPTKTIPSLIVGEESVMPCSVVEDQSDAQGD